MKSYLLFKRILDFIFAAFFLIIFFPLFVVVAVLIKIDSRGPIIFKQSRIGKNGKFFRLWKFRTMCENAEKIGTGLSTAENDPRITKIGKILRKTSIDELPQLVNILKGEMSFIGPRPAPTFHLEKYSKEDMKRLEVLPGLTGWAQVNGRNKLTWPEKIKKDIWYVNNLSILVDIKIVLKTIKIIILLDGIYSGRNDHKMHKNKNL